MSARVTVTMTATGPNMGRVSYTREALLDGDGRAVGMDDAVARVAGEASRAGRMLPVCKAGLGRALAMMSGEEPWIGPSMPRARGGAA